MKPEERVLEDVRNYLRGHPAKPFFCKIHGSRYQKNGLPDLFICYKGYFLGVELKRPEGGRLDPMQRVIGKQIRDAQGVWEVVCSLEELQKLLDRIDRL